MKRTVTAQRLMLVALLLAAAVGATAAESRTRLSAEIVKAEDAYFALYNQLNTDDQYDVLCRKERPTGTNFFTRVCKPQYVEKAQQESASERMRAATSAGDTYGSANSRGPDVGNVIAASPSAEAGNKQDAFRRNMLSVLQKSPELQALGKQRDDLQARYDALTKGKSK